MILEIVKWRKETNHQCKIIFTAHDYQLVCPNHMLNKSKALLVNTVKDNNMISIVEAIAVGTPIVTTDVPLNSTYIKDYQLGIAKKQWDESDLNDVVSNSEMYIENCMKYRYKAKLIFLMSKRRNWIEDSVLIVHPN